MTNNALTSVSLFLCSRASHLFLSHLSRRVEFIQYEGWQGPVPVFAGSQPSAKLCRGLRGKRKLNHEDCVQNPRATKKIAILAEAVGEAFSTHGSLKGELLARSLVQSKWKSMLFKGKPNGKILCASHG
jgi:hypothetical protein